MLRPTPGALISHLLEERPASLPTQLYVTGGRPPSHFRVVEFTPAGAREHAVEHPEHLAAIAAHGHPLWLRVMGLSHTSRILAMLEPLAIPDTLLPPLLEMPQRPRVDGLGQGLLVVLHRLSFAHDPSHLVSSQLGLLLLPNRLVSFEETGAGRGFSEITEPLQAAGACQGPANLDNILHILIDEVLDDLYPMLEQIANRLDDLEEATLRTPKPKLLSRTFVHRTNLRRIRNQIWPLRHQIRVLLRQRQDLLGEEARAGFREMGDMVELLFENCELLRQQCDAITQSYSASISNRMNQVMKTLTIITCIFAPLTFIGGIYGMNFEDMPELKWEYGYEYALLLMALFAAFMVWWFWRRGWFEDWITPR